MACTAPIVVKHPESGLLSEVRCGQCRTCRLRRKKAWVGRLSLEAKEHFASRFITLTYKEDPGILDYRDFQLFMKRYREAFGECRFFCVGEYGDKNLRGHYHAIIFGHAPRARGFAHDLPAVWEHGFCYDGTVTPESIGYVAGYCFKENYAPGKSPFVRMSLKPGIGMEKIGEMGRLAARSLRLSRWPSSYSISGKNYPLCDGGLAKFQTEYLESGGLPPPLSSPVGRDTSARYRTHQVLGRGDLVFEETERSLSLHMRYNDGSAQKKER